MLAEAGESLERFFAQGLVELGDKLGPVLWQFAPTKKFDADDFGAFLKLLPKEVDGLPLRHALEPRHDSFCTPAFAALLRQHDIADGLRRPRHAIRRSPTSPATSSTPACRPAATTVETAYAPAELDAWAGRLETWAAGGRPTDLPAADPATARGRTARRCSPSSSTRARFAPPPAPWR